MYIKTPFEQFELIVLKKLVLFGFDFSITNFSISLMVSLLFLLGLFYLSSYELKLIPNNWQNFFELIFGFIVSLVKDQLSTKGIRYIPLVFVIFTFILTMNLMGLLPFGYTVTSQVVITFMLALTVFISLIIIGFYKHGLSFLKIFIPSGIPMWLLPILSGIEIMSYCLRPISLAIRLGANMLAGHVLLHIVAGATLYTLSLSIFLVILPILFILFFIVLELGIAVLQAYVFSILTCIYLFDSLYTHH